ncbi:hypothetical protein KW842_18450 [Duganella sp. sic0402]|uniref:hypothetical protein n=1 Tax=Duganella sp. sic0402 TaxID=2854786 RepID=UPI001C44D9A0|nr:hypothetical protein [Duganella sp. sic0402]MBV7537753.1 hypothetical protein [Duganella sp. sic0402]
MSTITLTADDALQLSAQFRNASTALGDYLYAPENWPNIPEKERATLQSLEVTLLNVASDLVTRAVGVIIAEAEQSVADLVAVTSQARDVIKNIDNITRTITVVTALIGLAAVIPTGNAGAIFGALKNLQSAVKGEQTAKAKKAKAK